MDEALKGRQIVISALIVLLMSVPFLDKPFHIDDTVVLRVTEGILENPLDPFGGTVDWFGTAQSVWEVTTNPPLLSYYLAPLASLSNYSEVVLHLAMVPFVLMVFVGALILGRRFTGRAWLPALFVVTSPGVWVSVNVMRDVPALGLGCLGLALFIRGADCHRRTALFWGSTLVGLAVLTKYSAIVLIPLLVLYLLFQRRLRLIGWVLPAVSLLLLWCALTWLQYGIAHPYYLLSGAHPASTLGFWDKFWAMLVIVGSTLFLVPVLLADVLSRRRWKLLGLALTGGVVSCLGAMAYHGTDLFFQYLFWTFLGAMLLSLGFAATLERGWSLRVWEDTAGRADLWFLLAWLMAPVLFSLLFAPFQAVRHLLLGLIPLALIAFRVGHDQEARPRSARIAVAALSIQVVVAFLVGVADYEYASSYRNFAAHASKNWRSDRITTWYVGHWGWKFYADRSGFRQIHGDGEFPAAGDIVLWPRRVHIGNVFSGRRQFTERLELIESIPQQGVLPIRTMNFRGASFYAVIRKNIPYRFQTDELEEWRVYRVRAGAQTGAGTGAGP